MPSRLLNSIRQAYEDVGRGSPLVLIHGHPFNRFMWRPQIDYFKSKYRVVAPDLLGYGERQTDSQKTLLSEFADDILALLEGLGIDHFVLCGLSMGGQIVLECYRQFSERISGLVLADTFAQLDSPERKRRRYEMADRLLAEGMRKYSQEELPKMIASHHVEAMPEIAQQVRSMMETTSPLGAAAALRGRAERIDYTPLLSQINVPALIVVGDQDEYTPVSDAQFMHERIPGSRIVVIEDAGHMPNLEQPAVFNAALEEFLQGIVADSSAHFA